MTYFCRPFNSFPFFRKLEYNVELELGKTIVDDERFDNVEYVLLLNSATSAVFESVCTRMAFGVLQRLGTNFLQ